MVLLNRYRNMFWLKCQDKKESFPNQEPDIWSDVKILSCGINNCSWYADTNMIWYTLSILMFMPTWTDNI